ADHDQGARGAKTGPDPRLRPRPVEQQGLPGVDDGHHRTGDGISLAWAAPFQPDAPARTSSLARRAEMAPPAAVRFTSSPPGRSNPTSAPSGPLPPTPASSPGPAASRPAPTRCARRGISPAVPPPGSTA